MVYNYCIFGAGLAGLSLANKLLSKNCSVILIDTKGIARGASGAPLGLVNPATGRFANKSWQAEACYEAIVATLDHVQSRSDSSLFERNGVIRPAMDQKIAKRMKDNFDATSWNENWCSWLTEPEINEKFPGLSCVEGGVWLPIGLSVKMTDFLESYFDQLKTLDLDYRFGNTYLYTFEDSRWNINLESEEKIAAEKIIITAGIESKNFDDWNFLPLIPVKGQLAVFKSEYNFPYPSSVSALGYYSAMNDKYFVAGSTYEHRFKTSDADEYGIEYLTKRLKKVLPHFAKTAILQSQWAGIRASTPDRMPILGEHPELKNLSVFAGLGSKGLLYSSYLAELFCDFLLEKKSLPGEISVDRFH